ncbi:hypothetical protein T484DRAFT_1848118, partial [Baffinella frigidus]
AGRGPPSTLSATPLIPMLERVERNASSLLVGDVFALSLSFTLATALQTDDKLSIVLPADFEVGGASVAPGALRFREQSGGEQAGGGLEVLAAGGLPCGYRCTPTATTLVFARTNIGPIIPSGSTVLLTIEDLKSRGWEGESGVLQIRTTNALGNYTRDEALLVTSLTLIPGPIANLTVDFASYVTGETGAVRVSFISSRNSLDADAR